MVPVEHVIGLSAVLFGIGLAGAMVRRSLIAILLSVELMLNAANLAFVTFNRMWAMAPDGTPQLDGQVFSLFVIAVAAAEIAVALGIVVSLVHNRDSMNIEDASVLKW